ncbi:hypothetical protein PENSTE_c010G10280 [Penicillium steckii]|uniref:Amino acid transporter transmembrane domain-containing protein n=1 Tax=Penicillium steckii TaxID=303698 RepID=A0A1V6T817_9EURO|nr:hypothetical protein PENSTE_c010G10280 [Penicillium steckii]
MKSRTIDLPSMESHGITEEHAEHASYPLADLDDKKEEPSRQDAFGDEEFAEVKYKVLKWWQCGLLMVAETISLGILSLPAAIAGLGIVPGIILLIGLGFVASYTGFIMGQFKWRHPHVSSIADAGEVLMGSFGRELFFTGHMLYLIFVMASHILTFTVAMNTITENGSCSLVFGIIGTILSFVLSLPRTMEKMTWLSLASFISILVAVLATMIALGIQNSAVTFSVTKTATLANAFISVCNIVFAYASHNTFFNMMAELEDPRQFPKALALLQSINISLYVVISLVIYRYAGDGVASPALGSTSPIASKVAYGLALPTIVIAGVIYGHVALKTVYIRIFAGTERMHKKDFVAVGSWVGMGLGFWVIGWIIASAIPVFNDLLSLMSALFASWFSFGIPAILWLHMNQGVWLSSARKIVLTGINFGIICIAVIVCGLGVYASGKAIHDSSASGSFSCATNA